MERAENFPSLTISTLRIRAAGAAVRITVNETADIQVVVSGEHPDSVKLLRQEGILNITQPLHPMRKVSEITVILPMDWKGAVDARTLTGTISASGVTGTDLALRSLTGGIYAEALTGITAHLRTATGSIGVSDLACDRCRVRTLTGQMILSACGFMACKASALFSRAEMDLVSPFDSLSVCCLFGGMTVYAPLTHADATLSSIRGRMLTEDVSIVSGAPRVAMKSVAANLQLICSLETQAMM